MAERADGGARVAGANRVRHCEVAGGRADDDVGNPRRDSSRSRSTAASRPPTLPRASVLADCALSPRLVIAGATLVVASEVDAPAQLALSRVGTTQPPAAAGVRQRRAYDRRAGRRARGRRVARAGLALRAAGARSSRRGLSRRRSRTSPSPRRAGRSCCATCRSAATRSTRVVPAARRPTGAVRAKRRHGDRNALAEVTVELAPHSSASPDARSISHG